MARSRRDGKKRAPDLILIRHIDLKEPIAVPQSELSALPQSITSTCRAKAAERHRHRLQRKNATPVSSGAKCLTVRPAIRTTVHGKTNRVVCEECRSATRRRGGTTRRTSKPSLRSAPRAVGTRASLRRGMEGEPINTTSTFRAGARSTSLPAPRGRRRAAERTVERALGQRPDKPVWIWRNGSVETHTKIAE